jgi:thioesterase domain-containing protein
MEKDYTHDVPASADENLVLLRKGTDKTKHLFLVHAGSGEVDGYLEFCSNLEPTFHCWGIKSSRINDYAPLTITIEEIARKYVEKIKTIQPRGAYHFAGWCIGGTIAFEMVNRMEEKEEDIAFFSLINSDPPSIETANSVRQFTVESESDLILQLLPGNINEIKEKIGSSAELNRFWLDLVDYLTANNIEPAVLRKLFPQNIAEAVPNFEQLEVKSLLYYLNTIRTFDNARNAYVPQRNINTPVYFFGARDAEVKNRHIWNDYCRQPFKFYQAAGDHFSIFRKPGVLQFSGLFTSVLNRVSSVKYIPDKTSIH